MGEGRCNIRASQEGRDCYVLTGARRLNNMRTGYKRENRGTRRVKHDRDREQQGVGRWMERADQEPASARGQELPEPLPLGKLIGASVILLATALGSGELLIWPYITTQAGVGAAVAGDPGFPVAVLPQHGDRTLHPGDRRDRRDRLQPLLETLGDSIRPWRDLAERFPWLGGERSHVADLPHRLG